MKKTIAALVGVAAVLLTAGCTDNFKDLEGVTYKDPDLAEGYNNVDENPNITFLCIHQVAFATITRDYNSIMRVPEWDHLCPGYAGK